MGTGKVEPVANGPEDRAAQADRARHSFSHRLRSAHTRLVEGTSARQVFASLNLGVPSLFMPALGGEPLRFTDLRQYGNLARNGNEFFVVDNSIPTSFGCPAIQLGAHMVIESLDYVLGQEMCGAFAVSYAKDAVAYCNGVRQSLDALPGISDERGAQVGEALRTFNVRRRKANDVAQVIALFLMCHPKVHHVSYPGLPHDHSHEAAAKQLRNGFGPVVDFALGPTYRLNAEARVLCGDAFVPGGEASRLQPLGSITSEDGEWYRLWCGTGDSKELAMQLEALFRPL
jgi:cystathionine beta-lyase/cystathionine gamma-synthase